MPKKGICLVIGANGFVGSHLVDGLVEAGYDVRAFDRFRSPVKFNSSKKVKIIKADIFDDLAVHDALQGVKYVFHSFSATTPFASDADPYRDITLNLLRNVQLFEKSVEAGIKKFMFISSGGAVYGAVAEHKPATEADVPLPVSPYGIGKLGAEYYLAYFNRKYDFNYITYRLTNPYGPRQATNRIQGVIPIFANKVEQDEELVVYGDGSSSRDYIYVRDAIDMIVESFSKETKYKTYNIGSGRQTDLKQIISAIERVLEKPAKVTYAEAPKTFLQSSQVSIDRFIQEFGEAAETSLEDGIRMTIKETTKTDS